MIGAILNLLAYAALLLLLTVGGNFLCRLILKRCRSGNPAVGSDDSHPISAGKAGRTIGALERILIAVGLFANSWEVIIAVVALKTVARYQELDERSEAEYFLIGSLASILWAILISALALIYDQECGWEISRSLFEAIGGS